MKDENLQLLAINKEMEKVLNEQGFILGIMLFILFMGIFYIWVHVNLAMATLYVIIHWINFYTFKILDIEFKNLRLQFDELYNKICFK